MSGRGTRDPFGRDSLGRDSLGRDSLGRDSGGRNGDPGRRQPLRAQLPLLDRLIDDAPDRLQDAPTSTAETLEALRVSVRRDLEALLNARRPWRSVPVSLRELPVSPLGYGIPDFNAGAFSDMKRREALRSDIELTIRRFEPRLTSVHVSLIETRDRLDSVLRLRIDGLMYADPAPEPVAFDTVMDATTSDVFVRATDDV